MPPIATNLALLLTTAAGFTFAALNEIPQAPLIPETVNTTLLGGSGFDQVRFLQCVKDDPSNFGRMIAYYSHPPQGSEKPTQVALKELKSVQWGDGCHATGESSDGAGWECQIDNYIWSEDIFQAYVGNFKYGFTGFNCYIDDGHGAHLEGGDFGMCYCELYCTYEHAKPVAINAAKETVKVIYKASALDGKEPHGLPAADARGQVRDILEKVKSNVGSQQCGASLIQLSPACSMSTDCVGDHEYTQKLVDALIAVYDTDKNLFRGIDEKDCTPQQPICDPATGKCREQPDICDYTKGVEMPRKYVTSILDKAPPNSGATSPPLGQLTVEIACEYHNNDIFCDAMKTLLSGLGMFGPLSKIFNVVGLGVEGACS